MTKFTLSTYLMVSVLVILSGILWILFSQIDSSYEYPILSADIEKEQNDIINRIYQIKPTVIQQEIVAKPEVTSPELPLAEKDIRQTKVETTQLSQISNLSSNQRSAAYNDVWSTFPETDFQEIYFLKNNPWSPEYKPGY